MLDGVTSRRVAVLRKTNENIPGVLTFDQQKFLDWVLCGSRRDTFHVYLLYLKHVTIVWRAN